MQTYLEMQEIRQKQSLHNSYKFQNQYLERPLIILNAA